MTYVPFHFLLCRLLCEETTSICCDMVRTFAYAVEATSLKSNHGNNSVDCVINQNQQDHCFGSCRWGEWGTRFWFHLYSGTCFFLMTMLRKGTSLPFQHLNKHWWVMIPNIGTSLPIQHCVENWYNRIYFMNVKYFTCYVHIQIIHP